MMLKIRPDVDKAKALLRMAEITLQRLETTEKEKYPSNTLCDYYDSIHKIMDARALSDGIKIKGEGAHQELIEYMKKKRYIDEKTRTFLQEMREYRNRITYERFSINMAYVKQYASTIQDIIKRLQ